MTDYKGNLLMRYPISAIFSICISFAAGLLRYIAGDPHPFLVALVAFFIAAGVCTLAIGFISVIDD